MEPEQFECGSCGPEPPFPGEKVCKRIRKLFLPLKGVRVFLLRDFGGIHRCGCRDRRRVARKVRVDLKLFNDSPLSDVHTLALNPSDRILKVWIIPISMARAAEIAPPFMLIPDMVNV